MNTNETTTIKMNRYTKLDESLKKLRDERKAMKAVYTKACEDALMAYRKYLTETYKPTKKNIMKTFEDSRIRTYTKKQPTEMKIETPAAEEPTVEVKAEATIEVK